MTNHEHSSGACVSYLAAQVIQQCKCGHYRTLHNSNTVNNEVIYTSCGRCRCKQYQPGARFPTLRVECKGFEAELGNKHPNWHPCDGLGYMVNDSLESVLDCFETTYIPKLYPDGPGYRCDVYYNDSQKPELICTGWSDGDFTLEGSKYRPTRVEAAITALCMVVEKEG